MNSEVIFCAPGVLSATPLMYFLRRDDTQAGWPRQTLLMTIVHRPNGEGHAVLTVKTDLGGYILNNLTDEILLWPHTTSVNRRKTKPMGLAGGLAFLRAYPP
jgi:Bacterial transglutaminase-like cysteine proteinase BTLCP